jgi:hypothetical protein
MEFRGQRFSEDGAQGPDEGTPQRAQFPGQKLFLSKQNFWQFIDWADAGGGVHPFAGLFSKIFSFFLDIGILLIWISKEESV